MSACARARVVYLCCAVLCTRIGLRVAARPSRPPNAAVAVRRIESNVRLLAARCCADGAARPIVQWGRAAQASIVVSTIVVLIEDPADDDSPLYITVLELIFGVIFSVELILKVLGLGIDPRHSDSYFRDQWNIVDFLVVVVFYVTTCTPSAAQYSFLRTVRAFRALRPIKLISKHAGIKHVVNCILMSVPPALNVLLVCALFFLVFAIVAVELFRGKFARCNTSQEWDAPELNSSGIRDWLDCQGAGFPGALSAMTDAWPSFRAT